MRKIFFATEEKMAANFNTSSYKLSDRTARLTAHGKSLKVYD